jgi:hypothetical protein
MLLQAFFGWIGSILAWVYGFVVLPLPPAFIGEGADQLALIVRQSAALCRFVDFTMWPDAIKVVLNVYVASLLIRVLRVAFGFFVG